MYGLFLMLPDCILYSLTCVSFSARYWTHPDSVDAIISPFFPLFLPIPTISAPSGHSDIPPLIPLPFRSPRSLPRFSCLVSRIYGLFLMLLGCVLYSLTFVSFSARYWTRPDSVDPPPPRVLRYSLFASTPVPPRSHSLHLTARV